MKLNGHQIKYMQEYIAVELVQMLMEEWNYDTAVAMEVLYNSETFERLSDPSTGLYYQSPGYVYDFLQNELKTGRFC